MYGLLANSSKIDLPFLNFKHWARQGKGTIMNGHEQITTKLIFTVFKVFWSCPFINLQSKAQSEMFQLDPRNSTWILKIANFKVFSTRFLLWKCNWKTEWRYRIFIVNNNWEINKIAENKEVLSSHLLRKFSQNWAMNDDLIWFQKKITKS